MQPHFTESASRSFKQPAPLERAFAFWGDALALALVFAVLACLIAIAEQFTAPLQVRTEIDLSLGALPHYAILSLTRAFVAYALSLAFALTFGTIAAHHPRAERLMIPALDVLQSIPVLGFLPGLVLAMIALFPTREMGLEFASIMMVFTGQVWNMAFSFHGSLRSIPQQLRDVALVNRLSRWQVFRILEVPSAMIGLVWNSMMSMAGGWFFLMVTEAFTLRNQDYRLPGVGAYMNEAILRQDTRAMVAGILTMILIIVLVDSVVWRPLVVWSQRFKLEETTGSESPQSWLLNTLRRSHVVEFLRGAPNHRRMRPDFLVCFDPASQEWVQRTGWFRETLKAATWAAFLVGIVVLAWGGWQLVGLLLSLPLYNASSRADWLTVLSAMGASFLRTSAAVVLGALWTIPLGILIGLSPKRSRQVQPIIPVLASFPAPMLFPLVTVLLARWGIPFTTGCVLLLMLGTQWYILFNAIAGAQGIPADFSEVAQAFKLPPRRLWLSLYLPCVFPQLTTGLVTAAGAAWNTTIVAEYVLTHREVHSAFGIGSLINHATAVGDFPLLAAAVVTMSVTVVAINRLFWHRLYRLAAERFSLTG